MDFAELIKGGAEVFIITVFIYYVWDEYLNIKYRCFTFFLLFLLMFTPWLIILLITANWVKIPNIPLLPIILLWLWIKLFCNKISNTNIIKLLITWIVTSIIINLIIGLVKLIFLV